MLHTTLNVNAPGQRKLDRIIALLAMLAVVLAGYAASPMLSPAHASVPAVAAFPSPGTQYAEPDSQIAFRGISPSAIGTVTVVGSSTGTHTGHLAADSDGDGASFISDQPFANNETVTVTTSLNVIGSSNGTFSFKIANFAGLFGLGKLTLVKGGYNALQHFASQPQFAPPALTVRQDSAPASQGDIFVAPQNGPAQNGPMILDSKGNLVWYDPFPVSTNTLITNFRVQSLFGRPVLTWWQGNTNNGAGRGVGEIYNQSYQQVATVSAANGLQADLHEFLLTNNGDAYITAVSPVRVPGINKVIANSVVQEIDIRTGLVLFEWDALDHIPLSQSYDTPSSWGSIFDPYHANSISQALDGNLIVSLRNTSAVYKLNYQTGQIMWTFGGKASSFRVASGAATWGQHDAVMQPNGTLTAFDDGDGEPNLPYKWNARGVTLKLMTSNMTAKLQKAYYHAPVVSTNYEGSMQPLSFGDMFIGWGQQQSFSEDNAAGHQIFSASFKVPTNSYRAYRFVWNGAPQTPPALAVRPGAKGATNVYASWNGATNVASWRVLAGSSPSSMRTVGTARKSGFETKITVRSHGTYYAVQALGAKGHVLSTSSVTRV